MERRMFAVVTDNGKVWFVGVGAPGDLELREMAREDATKFAQKLKRACMLVELTQPLTPEVDT